MRLRRHSCVLGQRLDDEQRRRFVQITMDEHCNPALARCRSGSDRTQLLCALYCLLIEGWSRGDTIRELAAQLDADARALRALLVRVGDGDLDALRRALRTVCATHH